MLSENHNVIGFLRAVFYSYRKATPEPVPILGFGSVFLYNRDSFRQKIFLEGIDFQVRDGYNISRKVRISNRFDRRYK